MKNKISAQDVNKKAWGKALSEIFFILLYVTFLYGAFELALVVAEYASERFHVPLKVAESISFILLMITIIGTFFLKAHYKEQLLKEINQ